MHVINSAIVKSSKLTQAAKVYRGVAGGRLPDSFWTPNEYNVRGGIESAFLSTTLDRKVAFDYAGNNPGKPGLIFEVQMGMVDRGAELKWLSQCACALLPCTAAAVDVHACACADPHEEEILFAPLTGLEVHDFRVEGRVLVVEAKMSVNLNALTIEQVVSKRRKVVQDMCDQVLLRFEHEIPKRPDWQALLALRGDAVQAAAAELKRQLDGLSQRDAEHYNEDASLGSAITQAVESVGHAEAWADGLAKLVPKAGVSPAREPSSPLAWQPRDSSRVTLQVKDMAGLLSASSIDLKEKRLEATDVQTAVLPLLLVSGVLTDLNLKSNKLGAEGGTAIAEALRVNSVLTAVRAFSNLRPSHLY